MVWHVAARESLWVGILAEGRGLGLGRLIGGVVKPFVTPTFDGSKVVVNAMIFDRDGNLWVGTHGKGIFRIHGNVVDHYQQTEGLSSDTVLALFEDREGILWAVTSNGIDNFRDPSVTTFSAREGLGQTQQQAFWPAETARSGLQMLAHSIRSRTGQSRPFAQGMVFRVIKSPPCWKIAPETCGWGWMTHCICSRMGASAASPNRITSRLVWWLE